MNNRSESFHWSRPAAIIQSIIIIVALAIMAFTSACRADDITTVDGKKYEDVSNVKNVGDGIYFSYTTTNGVHQARVLFSKLPDELKQKYNYDPFAEGFAAARQNRPVILGLNKAFKLSDLEAAKKKAKEEKKLLGFILVWDSEMGTGQPMGQGSRNALADFYAVFNGPLVLVFVRHENELNLVPYAVARGLRGPEEGGFSPSMAVVDEDCSQFICEIPMGGKDSTGLTREKIFQDKIAVIKKFLADRAAGK